MQRKIEFSTLFYVLFMETPIEELNAAALVSPEAEIFKGMIDAGVFYGRKKSKTNPKVKSFIYSNRGGVEIIDLAKTLEGMNEAVEFLKRKVGGGGTVLLVGTQPSAANVLKIATELDLPVVARRWIGGTLTNFKTISKRIEYLKKLKSDMASGALDKYTKKERLQMDREIKRLEHLIGGLVNLMREPDVLVVVDPVLHLSAVREARRLKIPIVAFGNTDSDPDFIDYLVVGNNAARKSVDWFLERVSGAILEGKELALKTIAEKKVNGAEVGTQ